MHSLRLVSGTRGQRQAMLGRRVRMHMEQVDDVLLPPKLHFSGPKPLCWGTASLLGDARDRIAQSVASHLLARQVTELIGTHGVPCCARTILVCTCVPRGCSDNDVVIFRKVDLQQTGRCYATVVAVVCARA